MPRPSWVTSDIDLNRPSAARVYDYWLGGKDNFAADRIAGEETIAAYPAIRLRRKGANRRYRHRIHLICLDIVADRRRIYLLRLALSLREGKRPCVFR